MELTDAVDRAVVESWEGEPEDLDPTVPSPGDVLGSDACRRPARLDEVWRYVEALASASPLVALSDYGTSSGGRRLALATVGQPPDSDSASDARAQVWVGCAIHGDEPSGADAALAVLYRLAAGRGAESQLLRDRLVVHVDPVANPDGRDRHLAGVGWHAARHPSADADDVASVGPWPSGRGNHYLFDLNRDLALQTQPETRARTAAMLAVRPHLVLELHEMEHDDSFLFASPGEPLNPWLPDHVHMWWDRLAAAHGAALDRLGVAWYRGDWNEVFYPGYQDIWPAYGGAIPVIFEQARAGPTGVRLGDGRYRGYAEAVRNLVISVFANLRAAAEAADALRADWASARATPPDTDACLVVGATPSSSQRVRWLADCLTAQGVEVLRCARPSGGLAAGSLVVSLDQPARALARVLLEPDVALPAGFVAAERARLERGAAPALYDVTAWSPAMAAGLAVRSLPWSRIARDALTSHREGAGAPGRPRTSGGPRGFGVAFHDDGYRMVAAALEAGVVLRMVPAPAEAAGQVWPAGAVVARHGEQRDPGLASARLAALADDHGVELVTLPSARADRGGDWGSRALATLRAPRIGLLGASGVDEPSFGGVRHLLDVEAGVPSTVIDPLSLPRRSSGLDVIVMPEVVDGVAATDVVSRGAIRWLDAWVRAGGVLVAVGSAAALPGAVGIGGSRVDESGRRWLPTGAFVEVDVLPGGVLTAGLEPSIPALCRAAGVVVAAAGARVAARYAPADRLRMAGLVWDEARGLLADTPYLLTERVGAGAVVLFASDPVWRGAARATSRLLLRTLVTPVAELG